MEIYKVIQNQCKLSINIYFNEVLNLYILYYIDLSGNYVYHQIKNGKLYLDSVINNLVYLNQVQKL